jgi:hypothetical protein
MTLVCETMQLMLITNYEVLTQTHTPDTIDPIDEVDNA